MMKVIVTNYLNVRVGQPRLSAPCYQYLAPGSELDVDGVEYDGDFYEGTSKWMKDAAGNYYWKGGLSTGDTPAKPAPSVSISMTELIDYRKKIKLMGEIPGDDGATINIALLDTGINKNHPDFSIRYIQYGNIHNSWNDVLDNNGHGTHLGGLICANSKKNTGIIGLVPGAKLTVFKVINDDISVNIESVTKALESIAASDNIDLVNMSFNITNEEFTKLTSIIKKIYLKGIVMTAAAGNGRYLQSRCYYPACSEQILSVGALENESLEYFKKNGFYKSVNYFFLNEKLKSLSNKDENYNILDSCSVYTAILSGLIARQLSSIKTKTDRNTEIIKRIHNTAKQYSAITSLESMALYKTN
jgi:subtilisin family serine protease